MPITAIRKAIQFHIVYVLFKIRVRNAPITLYSTIHVFYVLFVGKWENITL